MKFVAGENGRNPEKNLPRLRPPRNPHGVIEMQVVGDECGEMVEWNVWQGKMGEILRKTYPDSAHQETHME